MSCVHRFAAAAGLLALPLVFGCVGEGTDQRANFPGAVGSDPPASQGGIPEDLPTHDVAMEGVADAPMPGYPEQGDDGDGYADTDPSALTDFHGALDDHGQWVQDPSYGTMWQPSASEVGTDFAPYVSGGHWGYDNTDYVWVSDYSWGWAPFHYGRWTYGTTGWGWIPGRRYAPSWVTWRTGYPGFGYVGWAPLPPTWYWGTGGVALGLGGVPVAPYAFCPTGSLFATTGLSGQIVSSAAAVRSIAGQTHAYSAPPGSSGGRYAATPTVGGPTPQSLNIPSSQVNHVLPTNAQLARAQQFARPSTAMALGAHGPAVGGQLGALSSGAGRPAGAAGRSPVAARAAMPSYGGASHSYYNSRASTQLGSTYGHGGSMRSYGSPGAAHMGSAYHPTYAPAEVSAPHPSSSHFGGHYGGGGGHSGGGHGGGHR